MKRIEYAVTIVFPAKLNCLLTMVEVSDLEEWLTKVLDIASMSEVNTGFPELLTGEYRVEGAVER